MIAGGRNDTVSGNLFVRNGSWAVLVVPFIDTDVPPPISHCEGGVPNFINPGWCYYAPWGNEVSHNLFLHNGGFGNPTNGDLADLSELHDPGNCWHGNRDPAGVTTAPADLQRTNRRCGVPHQGAAILGSDLSNQVICASEILAPARRRRASAIPAPPTSSCPGFVVRRPCRSRAEVSPATRGVRGIAPTTDHHLAQLWTRGS